MENTDTLRLRPAWYGGPTVIIDTVSLVMLFGGLTSENGPVFMAGTAGYALGAPIVHLANGRPGRALASFGLRTLGAGVASGAVLLDVLSHPCDGEPSCRHYPAAGVGVGVLALLGAIVLDDAWLARDQPATSGSKIRAGIVLGPRLALVSLGGRL